MLLAYKILQNTKNVDRGFSIGWQGTICSQYMSSPFQLYASGLQGLFQNSSIFTPEISKYTFESFRFFTISKSATSDRYQMQFLEIIRIQMLQLMVI